MRALALRGPRACYDALVLGLSQGAPKATLWLTLVSLALLALLAGTGCWTDPVRGDTGPVADAGGDTGPAPDTSVPPPTPYASGVGYPFDADPLRLDDANLEGVSPATLPVMAASPCREPVLVTVTRVLDGDTIFVNAPGLAERVRLIGIDTPEIAHDPEPAECYGVDAHEFTKALQSRTVWLTFDAECRDPFERLLAYVWVGNGPQDLWARQIMRRGYARTLTIAPNTSFVDVLSDDQFAATSASAGLWGACR